MIYDKAIHRAVRCASTILGIAAVSLFTGASIAHAATTLTGDTNPAPGNEGTLNSSTNLTVGETGVGGLLVDADSDFATSTSYLGNQSGSTGSATVTGSGSTWTSSEMLYVGNHGSGTLEIRNGGAVSNSNGLIGSNATGIGAVTVNGSTSSWTNSGVLYVGHYGNGTLNVENGGTVSNGGSSAIGYESTGIVTVTDSGSTWNSSKPLSVGTYGTGTLNILAGGAVTNSIGYLGNYTGSTGAATVTGAGSTWTSSSWLRVGHAGTGTLTLADSGRMEIGGDLIIADQFGSTGTVNLHGGILDLNGNDINFGNGSATFSFTAGTLQNVGAFGSDLNQQGGLIQIGSSPGVMTINGDYTQADGAALEIELFGSGGVAGTDFDRLQADLAALTGLIDVRVDDSYAPTVGESWDVVTASTLVTGPSFKLTSQPGYQFDWSVIGGNTLRLTLAAVPEPATAASLIVLLVPGLARRRRA